MPKFATYSATSGTISIMVANGLSRTYVPGSRVNLSEVLVQKTGHTLEQALGHYISLFTLDPVEEDKTITRGRSKPQPLPMSTPVSVVDEQE